MGCLPRRRKETSLYEYITSPPPQPQGHEAEEDAFEFVIVSLDNKQWQFEAGSAEDRDEWLAAIEQQGAPKNLDGTSDDGEIEVTIVSHQARLEHTHADTAMDEGRAAAPWDRRT